MHELNLQHVLHVFLSKRQLWIPVAHSEQHVSPPNALLLLWAQRLECEDANNQPRQLRIWTPLRNSVEVEQVGFKHDGGEGD